MIPGGHYTVHLRFTLIAYHDYIRTTYTLTIKQGLLCFYKPPY